jgi:hypothetical protein
MRDSIAASSALGTEDRIMSAEQSRHERPWLTDFATIFAHMWYRDFPLQRSLRDKAQRADWTTHIGITVRATADLLGLFTHFESGGRTDAVLRDAQGAVAALEWEWAALHRGDTVITEFGKLQDRCASDQFRGVRFAGLIGYARETSVRARDDYTSRSAAVLEGYTIRWPAELPPLLLVVVHFEWGGRSEGRQFTIMTIDAIEGGNRNPLRVQPAYPWDVANSRWSQETRSSG